MSRTFNLEIDWNMYDCLQLAVVGLRDEIDSGDLVLGDDSRDDILANLSRLENLLSIAEKELKEDA